MCSSDLVLSEVAGRIAPPQPITLLDLGAGLGSMAWAARGSNTSLGSITLIESSAEMLRLGRALAADAGGAALHPATQWQAGDFRNLPLAEHDLVTFSYSLGELTEAAATKALDAAWRAARQALVIIEPGTPGGFARVRQWRERLLGMGAHMLAPCPHERACPLPAADWCHFAQRVERTALHRRLKGGELGHEDEKFSYIAVGRQPGELPAARIIRHPQTAAGAINLELCTDVGLRKITATKRDREQFRQARHARWGGHWVSGKIG